VKVEIVGATVLRITGDRLSATDALRDIQALGLGSHSEKLALIPEDFARKLTGKGADSDASGATSCLSFASQYPLSDRDFSKVSSLTGVQVNREKDKNNKVLLSSMRNLQLLINNSIMFQSWDTTQNKLTMLDERYLRSLNCELAQSMNSLDYGLPNTTPES